MAPPDPHECLFIALTVDVDPDANRPVPGRVDAVSAGEQGDGIRLDACFQGLAIIREILADNGLPATFFWEGRTLEQLAERAPDLLDRQNAPPRTEHGCHGYRHEDFAGKVSGLPLGHEETIAIVARAGQAFAAVFGAPPRAFRAPYCRLTPELARALAELDYVYDASLTRRPSATWGLRPYPLPAAPALWELALCRSSDRQGRPISSYLWQLFEGNRPVEDYIQVVAALRRTSPGGLLQIALHPWHLVVSKDGESLTLRGQAAPGLLLRQVVEEATRLDRVAFTTCAEYLQRTTSARAV